MFYAFSPCYASASFAFDEFCFIHSFLTCTFIMHSLHIYSVTFIALPYPISSIHLSQYGHLASVSFVIVLVFLLSCRLATSSFSHLSCLVLLEHTYHHVG